MNGLMMDMPLTLTSIMHFGNRVYPESEIVSYMPEGIHRYTFKDAFKRVHKLANALKKYNLSTGDRIATLAWNDYRHFELYYAVSCSGLVCHTINPRLFPQQVEYIINHAEDKVVFVDPMFVSLLESIQDRIASDIQFVILCDDSAIPQNTLKGAVSYESLITDCAETFDWPEIDEAQASALCYTSGTTGNPKGVLYSHRSTVLHTFAGASPNANNIWASRVMMPVVPMFHVNAWGLPYTCVANGAKVVFPGAKMGDPAALAQLINEEKVECALGVPTVWGLLLNYLEQNNLTVESLDTIVVGGSACPVSIMERFEENYGTYVSAAWGMTELSPLGTLNSKLDRSQLTDEQYRELRVKAGRPIYGIDMKIVDDQDNELPWDGKTFGKLKVRGPWVCKQYFKLEDSDAHDDKGWFDTGDIATVDAQGYMQITDRTKDVIKSGGEWISSIDLENTASDHPQIKEAAVIGVPHPKWDERPLLIVVLKGGQTVTEKEILEWFDGKVASWWIPDSARIVESLPHTATGKLDKKVLRAEFSA